ncbi:unnamed protein product, partial [marine sediment metagenome]
ELALDHVITIDVVLHALDFIERNENIKYDYACILEPTSPLRTGEDIDKALSKLVASDYDSLIGLLPAPCSSPYRIRYVQDDQVVLPFEDKFYDYINNKAKYPKAYIPGGGIFCGKVDAFRREKNLMPGKAMPYIMDFCRGIDINTKEDFLLVEALIRQGDILEGR